MQLRQAVWTETSVLTSEMISVYYILVVGMIVGEEYCALAKIIEPAIL